MATKSAFKLERLSKAEIAEMEYIQERSLKRRNIVKLLDGLGIHTANDPLLVAEYILRGEKK